MLISYCFFLLKSSIKFSNIFSISSSVICNSSNRIYFGNLADFNSIKKVFITVNQEI